jgi:hypothetical protein
MSKKPALPAELMAHHLSYRHTRPRQAGYLTDPQRFADQQHHEALRIVQRIEQRQAIARAIRTSEQWARPPAPDPWRRLALWVALAGIIPGAALLLGAVL